MCYDINLLALEESHMSSYDGSLDDNLNGRASLSASATSVCVSLSYSTDHVHFVLSARVEVHSHFHATKTIDQTWF